MLGDAAAWPWDLAQCRFPVATSVVGPITPERPELFHLRTCRTLALLSVAAGEVLGCW